MLITWLTLHSRWTRMAWTEKRRVGELSPMNRKSMVRTLMMNHDLLECFQVPQNDRWQDSNHGDLC